MQPVVVTTALVRIAALNYFLNRGTLFCHFGGTTDYHNPSRKSVAVKLSMMLMWSSKVPEAPHDFLPRPL
jgi:hypothetical protein